VCLTCSQQQEQTGHGETGRARRIRASGSEARRNSGSRLSWELRFLESLERSASDVNKRPAPTELTFYLPIEWATNFVTEFDKNLYKRFSGGVETWQ
jgi:hypothetical protein